MNEHKKLAIKALEEMRGDDLIRARMQFRGETPQRMNEQYGFSGRTRAQILAEYEAHDAAVTAAIAWVKAQGG